jgi:hypothetical protein
MTTTDRFEPYLEPLYIPAVAGSITAGFWYGATLLSLNQFDPRMLTINKIWAILVLGTILLSVLVLVYECLILFKVFSPFVLFKTQNKTYKTVRWILGTMGSVYVALTILFLIIVILFRNFRPG